MIIIQQIEQTPYELFVHGQTFYYNSGNPTFYGSWKSTGTSFDYIEHTLNFTYLIDKRNQVNARFGNYHFIYKIKNISDLFFGFYSNYTMEGKMVVLCKRHCDLEKIPDLHECIKEACIFYESNKKYFNFNIKD